MTPQVTLEHVAALARLHDAWAHVQDRGAAPGVDRLTVEAFARDAPARLMRLHHALLAGAWSPKPARRVQLPDDPDRPIAIPSVADRVVQRAIASALYPLYEARFSSSAWAYRPGRSMHTLLERVQAKIAAGYRWYVRTDIEKFFDRLDREYLLELIADDGVDPRVIALIEQTLNAGIYQGAHVFDPGRGAIQGASLSPLLSNIFLNDVDHALDRAGVFYARYADDILVLAQDETQARAALDQISALVEGLDLRLNAQKTQRGDIRDGMTFLGVRFDHAGRGFSERAHLALAEKMRAQGDDLEALAALAGAWVQWYGPPRPAHLRDLHVIAGFARLFSDQPAFVNALAARRTRLTLARVDPPSLHETLRAVWLALNTDEGRAAAHAEAALLGHVEVSEHAAPEAPKEEATPPPFDEAQLAALRARFGGLLRPHVIEAAGAARTAYRELGLEDLRAHLQGEAPRAIYLINGGDRLMCACATIEGVVHAHTAPADHARLARRSRDLAAAWARAAERQGLSVFIERSGPRVYRVLFLFAEEISMSYAHRILQRLAISVGATPEGIEVSHLPPQPRLNQAPGPTLRLPLGRDPVTGERGVLIQIETEHIIEDPIAWLLDDTRRISSAMARQFALEAPPAKARHDHPVQRALAHHEPALRVVTGCALLNALVEKALMLGYLDGLERTSIYESLRDLDQPVEALLGALRATGETRATIERRLKRRGDAPISCATMRKRHARIVEGGCACRFALRPGAYPSPVLHALRPEDVPGMGARVRAQRDARREAQRDARVDSRPEVVENASGLVQGRDAAPPSAEWGAAPKTLDDFADRLLALQAAEARIHTERARLEAALAGLFDAAGVASVSFSTGRIIRVSGDPPCFEVQSKAEPGSPGAGSGDL